MTARPDLEPFARATMRNLGRNEDDWRIVVGDECREFLAMMQAWEGCMAQGMVEGTKR